MLGHLLFLAASAVLVSAVHEAGHALLARPAGYRVTSFRIGAGPVIWHWRTEEGAELRIGAWLLAGGATVAVPAGRTRPALLALGGVLAQLLLAGLLLLLPGLRARQLLYLDLLVLAWSLLPWRWRGLASDGWRVLAALREPPPCPVLGQRRALERLLSGTPLEAEQAGVLLCWLDLVVGREPVHPLPPEASSDLARYLRAELLRRSGRAGAALLLVETEGGGFSSLAAARALAELGRVREALERARELAGPDALALRVALREPGWEELARRLARSPGPFLDPVQGAATLWEAGEAHRGAALRLARRCLALADPGDREALRGRLEDAGLALEGSANRRPR